MLATVLIKREQFHSNIIGQSVTPYGNTVEQFLFNMQQYFLDRGAGTAEMARHQAEILLGKLVAQQSLIMAFSDTFYVLCVVLVVAMGSVLMTRKNSGGLAAYSLPGRQICSSQRVARRPVGIIARQRSGCVRRDGRTGDTDPEWP